jgi:hypothetical protein
MSKLAHFPDIQRVRGRRNGQDSDVDDGSAEMHGQTQGVAALAVGDQERTGRFVYRVAEDSWSWSDTMYRIHGFEPGAVPASTEVLIAHKHPDDRSYAAEVLQHVLNTGEPISCYHRIVDAQGRVRQVAAVWDVAVDKANNVLELRGYLVDLTESRRRDTTEDANTAVHDALVHRAEIEQAKGALMFVYSIDADTAFAILVSASQHANLKVHDVATRLMRLSESSARELPTARRRLLALLECAVGHRDATLEQLIPADPLVD